MHAFLTKVGSDKWCIIGIGIDSFKSLREEAFTYCEGFSGTNFMVGR